MFFRAHAFQGPGFSGSSFFRVRVQVLEVANKKWLWKIKKWPSKSMILCFLDKSEIKKISNIMD